MRQRLLFLSFGHSVLRSAVRLGRLGTSATGAATGVERQCGAVAMAWRASQPRRRIGSERIRQASLPRLIATLAASVPASGWRRLASVRYARAISSRVALRGTPSTAYGSISGTSAAV